MRAIVTGAAGFIGSSLTRHLLREGATVAIVARASSDLWRIRPLLAGLTVIEGDLCRPESIERGVLDFAPDAVFHLAWHGAGNRFRNDTSQIDLNLTASLDLLRLAQRAGCRTWVALGSQAEYGPKNQPISEDLPTTPTTLYGTVKLCAGLLGARLAAQWDIRFLWLRVFSTYGPGDNPEWMIPYLIRTLLEGKRPSLTACQQQWDYLYVDDAAEAIYLAATTPQAQGVYNLGSGAAHPLKAIVEQIRALVDPAPALGFRRSALSARPGDAPASRHFPLRGRDRLEAPHPAGDGTRKNGGLASQPKQHPLGLAAMTQQPAADLRATRALARAIRLQSLGMVHRTRASHIGSCFSIADILAVLYGSALRVDSARPDWPGRDRFVLSKGHAAAAVYAALAESGFFPKEWLDTYCADGSRLAGHITSCGVPGVEVSTGSLGHGLPIGCGMALAAKADREAYRAVVLLSDGECDEGSNWEAALFAPHHKLDNLLVIVDYNKIQSFGSVKEVLDLEPLAEKWRDFGWAVREIDGHDHAQLHDALHCIPWTAGKPSALIANTIKGKGVSFMEGNLAWHYKSPSDEQLAAAIAELGAEP